MDDGGVVAMLSRSAAQLALRYAQAHEARARRRAMRMPEQRPDYGTPPEFIKAVELRFGPIVLDLAASSSNKKGTFYLSKERDSLSIDWFNECPNGNMWLNPPFADIGPWALKCALESRRRHGLILFLTPVSVGTEWYARSVMREAFVLALRPRLTFEGCDDPYPKDLILSVFGYGLHGFDTWRWK